jgi:two-component system response regulator YesN
MDLRIKLVMEITKRDLDQPLVVGLSESRFEHLFKAEAGQAFKTWAREARLEKAKELLLDPTQRISQVAFAIGYKFPPNFTHDFRKRFGIPPSQYRSPSA